MKTLILLIVLLPLNLFSQLIESFSDGDFTQNPEWTGTQNRYRVNDNFQLQLNDSIAGEAILFTSHSFSTEMEWQFWVKCAFSPSANNNVRVYLMSNQDSVSQNINAYYLQLGESGSQDAIELFRQEGEQTQSICRGVEGLIASSFEIRIRVTLSEDSLWTILTDHHGGTQFQKEADGTHQPIINAAYVGVFCKYTKSNSTKCYFDDIYVGDILVDNIPPEVISLSVLDDTSLTLEFNEPIDDISGSELSNYLVEPLMGSPSNIEIDEEDGKTIRLFFAHRFEEDESYTMEVTNIQDLNGNVMSSQQLNFTYHLIQAFDVVINEIMADPSPPVGLPNAEFLELYNQTPFDIHINQWQLVIGSTTKIIETATIPAESFLIVAKLDYEEDLSALGPFYGFESFSLTNSGQDIQLYDDKGTLITAVSYEKSWYGHPDKEEGGWTLELMNPLNICSGSDNWQASMDPSGGTPGRRNSIHSSEIINPTIQRLEVVADNILRLEYTQLMDTIQMTHPENYSVDQDIGHPESVFYQPSHPLEIALYFAKSFAPGLIYILEIDPSLTNCMGVELLTEEIIQFGIGEPIKSNDIVINELLFNPWTNGVDYVEIVNRSDKIIDLISLRLGSVSDNPPNPPDTLFYSIVQEQQLLFPGTYLLLSSEPETVKDQYYTTNPNGFLEVNPFPAYSNDAGIVLLSDYSGNTIDELCYSEDMQYPLLQYYDGVALERIHFDSPSDDQSNWHSASESAGFGTPAYQNSQFLRDTIYSDEITVEPEIFSPDNDGYHDYTSIKYQLDQAGYTLNVIIYNDVGQPIRRLVNNQYLGTNGIVNWDGLMDNNTKAPIGIYIIYAELFHTNGDVDSFKKAVVVAGKLR